MASQLCPLGPKERCTPSQAQAMGQQILQLMAVHETNGAPLPCEYTCTMHVHVTCIIMFITVIDMTIHVHVHV